MAAEHGTAGPSMKRWVQVARRMLQAETSEEDARMGTPAESPRPADSAVEPTLALQALADLPADKLEALLAKAPWRVVERLFETAERALLADANWRRSPPRVIRHFQRTALNLQASDVTNRRVLDFGCGHANPLAASLLFYLNGAAQVTATDLKPARDDVISAGLYYLAKSCALHPGEFAFWGTSAELILKRLRQVDMDALRRGDWRSALRDVPIRHCNASTDEYPDKIGPVDLVISQSVLEHVTPFSPVIAALAGLMPPEGKMVHYVDFNDHDRKANPQDKAARWRFLTTNETRGASHSNRIRLSQMVALIDGAGFRTAVTDAQRHKPPASLRGQLIEPFRQLSDDDLATTAAMLTCLRSA